MSVGTSEKGKRRALTAWELPALMVPLHEHKRAAPERPKERAHYLPIVAWVYRNRYAIAGQIQQRFSNVLKSDRTTRRHLAELESLGYLSVVPTRGTSPLWPKVYYTTARGAGRLRAALKRKGKPGTIGQIDRRRPGGCSCDHVLHEVMMTQFLLDVWQSAEANDELELLRVERRSIPSNPAFQIGSATRIEPDAMFVHREQGRGMICSFVEFDAGTMGKEKLRAKFSRYDQWAASERGQRFLVELYDGLGAHQPQPRFRLLIVAMARQSFDDDQQRLREVLDVAAEFPRLTFMVRATTVTRLRQRRFQQLILDSAIFLQQDF